jgi:hypothetical protein
MPIGLEGRAQGSSIKDKNNRLPTDSANSTTTKSTAGAINKVDNCESYLNNSKIKQSNLKNDTDTKTREKAIAVVEPRVSVNPSFGASSQNIVNEQEEYQQRIQQAAILFKKTHAKLQMSCSTIKEYINSIKQKNITEVEDKIKLWNDTLTIINNDLKAQASEARELCSEIMFSSLDNETEEEENYTLLLLESSSLVEFIEVTIKQLEIYYQVFNFIKEQNNTDNFFDQIVDIEPTHPIDYKKLLAQHDVNVIKTYESIKNIFEDIDNIKITLQKLRDTEATLLNSEKKAIIELSLILEENTLNKFVDEYNAKYLLYTKVIKNKQQLIEKKQDELYKLFLSKHQDLSSKIDKISENLFTLTSIDGSNKLNSSSLQNLATTREIIKTQYDNFNALFDKNQLNILDNMSRMLNTKVQIHCNKKIANLKKAYTETENILFALREECSLNDNPIERPTSETHKSGIEELIKSINLLAFKFDNLLASNPTDKNLLNEYHQNLASKVEVLKKLLHQISKNESIKIHNTYFLHIELPRIMERYEAINLAYQKFVDKNTG